MRERHKKRGGGDRIEEQLQRKFHRNGIVVIYECIASHVKCETQFGLLRLYSQVDSVP